MIDSNDPEPDTSLRYRDPMGGLWAREAGVRHGEPRNDLWTWRSPSDPNVAPVQAWDNWRDLTRMLTDGHFPWGEAE